jgi:hypothetical protein
MDSFTVHKRKTNYENSYESLVMFFFCPCGWGFKEMGKYRPLDLLKVGSGTQEE